MLQGAEHIFRLGYAIPTAIMFCALFVGTVQSRQRYIMRDRNIKKRLPQAIAPPTKAVTNLAKLYTYYVRCSMRYTLQTELYHKMI